MERRREMKERKICVKKKVLKKRVTIFIRNTDLIFNDSQTMFPLLFEVCLCVQSVHICPHSDPLLRGGVVGE